jgi:mono/diheme cytochrome c family protein
MSRLIFLFFIWVEASAQTIHFDNGKTFKLEELKKNYKTQRVSTYNYYINRSEAYYAFDMKKILQDVYGNKPKEFFGIQVSTTDKYTPIIEMYKFQERNPYLAYARADQKPFTTIKAYKDRVIQLAPFYLIWEEDYKKDAAKRKNHWPYKVTGFSLVNEPPLALRPSKKDSKDIIWGYKNYIKQCIACHQLNGFGGKKGGELLSSGIIKKRSDKYLAKFIDYPRKVNPKATMDPFPLKIDIRKKRIKNIVQYLRYLQEKDEAPPKRYQTIQDLNKLLQQD